MEKEDREVQMMPVHTFSVYDLETYEQVIERGLDQFFSREEWEARKFKQ